MPIQTAKLAGLVLVGLCASSSHARDNMYLSINPMSCTPTSGTLAELKYITSAGRVKFKKGVTGLISFVCAIPPFKKSAGLDASNLTMDYYQGSFGGQISAKIRRVHRKSGAVEDVVSVKSVRGGDTKHFRSVSGHNGSKISFDDFSYYVQFTLKQDRIEMTEPDDVGGGTPRQREMAILNLHVRLVDG